MKHLLVHAVPFGYGPATTALAIVRELRALTSVDALTVTGLCRNPACSIFRSSTFFDSVLVFRLSYLKEDPARWRCFAQNSDGFLTVGDYYVAEALCSLGVRPFYVDLMSWLMQVPQADLGLCRHSYVVDGRLTKPGGTSAEGMQGCQRVTSVPPIWNTAYKTSHGEPCQAQRRELLVNFGGMVNPLGDPWPAVEAMVPLVEEAAVDCGLFDHLEMCGGDSRLSQFDRPPGPGMSVSAGPRSHVCFMQHLQDCDVFATVAGLSVTCESVGLGRPMIVLPPLNYSHYLQTTACSDLLAGSVVLTWEEILEREPVELHLTDELGCQSIFGMGQAFSTDEAAQDRFRARLRQAFSQQGQPSMACPLKESLPNGARLVAESILQQL